MAQCQPSSFCHCPPCSKRPGIEQIELKKLQVKSGCCFGMKLHKFQVQYDGISRFVFFTPFDLKGILNLRVVEASSHHMALLMIGPCQISQFGRHPKLGYPNATPRLCVSVPCMAQPQKAGWVPNKTVVFGRKGMSWKFMATPQGHPLFQNSIK